MKRNKKEDNSELIKSYQNTLSELATAYNILYDDIVKLIDIIMSNDIKVTEEIIDIIKIYGKND